MSKTRDKNKPPVETQENYRGWRPKQEYPDDGQDFKPRKGGRSEHT